KVQVAEEKVEAGKIQREKLTKTIQELDRKVQETNPGNQNDPPQIAAAKQNIEMARISLTQTNQRISEVELEPILSRVLLITPAGVPLEKDRLQLHLADP